MRICVITLGEEGGRIARAIAARHPGTAEARRGRDGELPELFARAFAGERSIVCVMAAGIALRMASPLLRGKLEDPALVVVDDAARHAISMLSGHEGGANRLAYEVAAATGAEPVVTTGSETSRRFVLGLGCRRGAPAPEIKAALLAFLSSAGLEPADIRLAATIEAKLGETGLIEACADLDMALRFYPEAEVVALVAAREAGGESFSPSAASRHEELGVPSVAEPCALLAARRGRLIRAKEASAWATFALAEEEAWDEGPRRGGASGDRAGDTSITAPVAAKSPSTRGPAARRGSLAIVGLGPGSLELLTPAARRAILRADFIAGYGPYIDLIAPLVKDKEIFSSSMMAEAERARKAIDAALSGRHVALVASGDACVYGIGGISLELATEAELGAIDLEIHPGVTAANAASALVGSPFENDYAVLSLSDLLTPRERILARLSAVASAGFALALYNPRSRTRKDLLREAVAILLESRPSSTQAAIIGDASRPSERKLVCELGALLDHEDEVGMTSIVLVASPAARLKGGLIVEPRGGVGR